VRQREACVEVAGKYSDPVIACPAGVEKYHRTGPGFSDAPCSLFQLA
jgi:hypothetical protein